MTIFLLYFVPLYVHMDQIRFTKWGQEQNLKSYVGCEVNQTMGTAVAYFNSIKVGELGSIAVPAKEDSVPLVYAIGNGIVVDDVKAFPSFLNGRQLRDSDLVIYNTPFAGYFVDTMSSFNLVGYCADNGATVQVKDAAGPFQLSAVNCVNNRFSIAMDISDGARFPIGANQIRIEYVVGGNTTEYYYDFRALGSLPSLVIGSPNPSSGNTAATFVWQVDYADAEAVTLSSSNVVLGGATDRCSVNVVGSGNSTREVRVTGCTGSGDLVPKLIPGGDLYADVTSGQFYSCGITSLGQLKCWGENGYSQLGNSVNSSGSSLPIKIRGTDIYSKVSAGWYHACGLTVGGKVKCWGHAGASLGIGYSSTDVSTPTEVVGGDTYTMISSGWGHTCGIVSGGTVKCWGSGGSGALGLGDYSDRNTPTAISDSDKYTVISAGGHHTCGITTTGRVKCWGENSSGQIGDGTNNLRMVPTPINDSDLYLTISAGGYGHTCGITTAGTAKCWGQGGAIGTATWWINSSTPAPIVSSDTYSMITAGYLDTCALTTSGVVQCWGNNGAG